MLRAAVLAITLLLTLNASAHADTFRGVMRITVESFDYCQGGWVELRKAGEQAFELPATVSVEEPHSDGSAAEDNPFHLFIGTGAGLIDGGLQVTSAGVVASRDGRVGPVLLQFWNLRGRKASFRGELVENGTRYGAGLFNLLPMTSLLVPCRPELGSWQTPHALRPGTNLRGEIDGDTIRVRIVGQSNDASRRFVASIVAER